jgi:hypothetical protein
MAGGGHGLPKVSSKPAIPYPSTPCGRVTPAEQTAYGRLQPLWAPHAVRLSLQHIVLSPQTTKT